MSSPHFQRSALNTAGSYQGTASAVPSAEKDWALAPARNRWGSFWLAACALLAACASRPPLPVLGVVPPFRLTDQAGRVFNSATLAGHVWVADFIYTTCPGPCPRMSSQMRRLQAATAAAPDVKLISFTVDPENDTPPVLAEYARHFAADPQRWTFLTGERARLNELGLAAFHLNSVDGSLIHSTRFALVDRRGGIRGYYSSGEEGFQARLLRDIRALEKAHS